MGHAGHAVIEQALMLRIQLELRGLTISNTDRPSPLIFPQPSGAQGPHHGFQEM